MTITTINNAGFFISGKFTDKTVTVPATTTLLKGTVLGEIITSGKLLKCAAASTDGSQVPTYVLAQDVTNATEASVDFSNVRVLREGEIDSTKLIFSGAETVNTSVASEGTMGTLLKRSGILVYNVQSIVS